MQKKEYSFDILRVIAMFMVVVIHVSNVYSRNFGNISNSSFFYSLIYNTICRISVPIFFMISGALLLDRKFDKNKYKKRILKYIILIAAWDIIYLIWEYFYLDIKYDKLYMLIFKEYRAHLWFLYTILIIYLLQPILKKILDKCNKYIKAFLLCVWFLLGIISMFNSFIANYFVTLIYIGYFIIGKYIYDFVKKKDLKKYSILFVVIIIVCFIVSIILNYLYSIKYNMFYNKFFAYRTPFIIISSILFFIIVISNYKKETLNKVLLGLSKFSLGVYLIHGIFLDIVKTYMNNNLSSIVGIPLYSIIIFILSIISVYLLCKIKLFRKILQ